MNSENRGVPLWIIITIALAVSLLSISGYDYLNKRYERQATREIAERHQQEKDSAAAEAVRNERLQQAIISVSGIQTGIAEYLADKGETPPNLEAIGFVSDYTIGRAICWKASASSPAAVSCCISPPRAGLMVR